MKKLKKSLLPLFLAIAMLVMCVGASAADSQTLTKLDKNNVSLNYSSTPYTNMEKTPYAKFDGKKLKKGTDYTVTYSNNLKVGTASAKIVGKGKYTGTVTKTFTITKAPLYADNITVKKGKTKAIECYVWLKDEKVYGTAEKVTVKVTSGKSNVKVSGLKVKGKKKGTAKLKLTVKGNSNISTKTIKVTVKK